MGNVNSFSPHSKNLRIFFFWGGGRGGGGGAIPGLAELPEWLNIAFDQLQLIIVSFVKVKFLEPKHMFASKQKFV
jgi:hypothetical protein